MKANKLLVCVVVVASCCACGPSDDSVLGEKTCPIINGVPDHSPEHKGVVMMQNLQGWCSGTLIAPMIVLTAGHCADAGAPTAYVLYFGDDLESAEERRVREVIYHPQFEFPFYDIALLRMNEPAPAWAPTVPYLPTGLKLTPDDVGTDVEIVGFGRDENDEIGRKLTITLPIHFVCTSEEVEECLVSAGDHDFYVPPNTISFDQSTGGICNGDSGGPVFIVREGTEYVAGVNSGGYGSCDMLSFSTKVDYYEAWINEFIGSFSVAGQACTNPSQCLSGFCVDGVCCQTACEDPCMVCNRPRAGGECLPADDGYPCPDADHCDGEEVCSAGACVDTEPPDCTTTDVCRVGACEPEVGCVVLPDDDGEACDNGNPCDGDDVCSDGMCVPAGDPLDCDDANPCTKDDCAPATGCTHLPVADGTACADDDLCNGDETCRQGVCTAAEATDCDDQNACTTDSCTPGEGCLHEPLADGTKCGDCRDCQGGLCLPKGDCGGGCATAGRDAGLALLLVIFMLLLDRRRY